MRVQVITENPDLQSTDNITVTHFSKPSAMDDYDVVVIDLSSEVIWRNQGLNVGDLDIQEDIRSLANMVRGTERASIVYVYPQNGIYSYNYNNGKPFQSMKIKSIVGSGDRTRRYLDCFPFDHADHLIVFEPTQTTIRGKAYAADFHYSCKVGDIITKSDRSEKITTICLCENKYITMLNICSDLEALHLFLETVFDKNEYTDIPKWVEEYNFGDDEEQRLAITTCEESIAELNKRIEEAQKRLSENARYKSILGSSGDELVEVVFDILEQMLDCDLSGFVDEKREDFLVEKEENVFIGEIKGVSTNVRNEHISQLDVHYQRYIDSFEGTERKKKPHGLLIICPFRTKQLKDREPIHEQQIELAQRNESLIIETSTLLKMFEMFRNGSLSSEKCEAVLAGKTGILTIDDFC